MKAFLDTSVYISHYRHGIHTENLQKINAEYTLYLHAVVLAELHAGATTPAFLKELLRLEKLFTEKRRLVVPQKRDYVATGKLLRKLRDHDLLDSKNSIHFADALLASSARHEGITLVTEDKDFERMRPFQRFSLALLHPITH